MGEGSQRDGGDRARPALVTGVQNGPELQLQVRLNVSRAEASSLLQMSRPPQLDPPRQAHPLCQTTPKGPLGSEKPTAAPASTELLASRAEVVSWCLKGCWQGTAAPHCPATQPNHSPLALCHRALLSRPCWLPALQCSHRLWKTGEASLLQAAEWQRVGGEPGAGLTQAAGEHHPAHPCAAPEGWLRALPQSPQLQHAAHWSPASSRHYKRHPDTD